MPQQHLNVSFGRRPRRRLAKYVGGNYENTLKNLFLRGTLKAISYYAIGFIIAWLTYLIFGWQYIHGPGLHHMIGLLVLAVGAVILIVRVIGLIREPRNRSYQGSLVIHLLVIAGFIVYLNSLGSSTNETSGIEDADSEELTFDKATKTIMIKNGLGDTTFLQVSDSVIIDKEGIKK